MTTESIDDLMFIAEGFYPSEEFAPFWTVEEVEQAAKLRGCELPALKGTTREDYEALRGKLSESRRLQDKYPNFRLPETRLLNGRFRPYAGQYWMQFTDVHLADIFSKKYEELSPLDWMNLTILNDLAEKANLIERHKLEAR